MHDQIQSRFSTGSLRNRNLLGGRHAAHQELLLNKIHFQPQPSIGADVRRSNLRLARRVMERLSA